MRQYIMVFALLMTMGAAGLYGQPLRLFQGDTVYRYAAIEERPMEFHSINLSRIDFPCVDRLTIDTHSVPQGQSRLVSESSYAASYSQDNNSMYMTGYRSREPFFNIDNKEIVFLTPVLMGWQGETENKREGSSEFIVNYRNEDLPDVFETVDALRSATAIQVSGTMEWQSESLPGALFYDYSGVIEGRAFRHVHSYEVDAIRIRSGSWKEVSPSEAPTLWALFNDRLVTFRNLFGEGDAVDRVRIYDHPHQMLVYKSAQKLPGPGPCNPGNSGVDVYVFPNPTYGDVNIQINATRDARFTFTIHNIIGKRLWQTTIESSRGYHKARLDVPSLQKGVYLYTVKNEQGDIIQSRRLVIIEL